MKLNFIFLCTATQTTVSFQSIANALSRSICMSCAPHMIIRDNYPLSISIVGRSVLHFLVLGSLLSEVVIFNILDVCPILLDETSSTSTNVDSLNSLIR